jgi:hypothetical protein
MQPILGHFFPQVDRFSSEECKQDKEKAKTTHSKTRQWKPKMNDLFALNREELSKTSPLMLNFPWEDRATYAEWLAQTYYMVNHSTRLVALAGAYTPLDKNTLHARFVDHSKEERGHQLIAVSDINALGYDLKDFPCLPPSACMYQVQYYWIQHQGVASFFGYTLALESLAIEFGPEVYRRVCAAHGKKAAKFLECHSDADVDHMKKAEQEISKLSQEELTLATRNLQLSASLYRAMLTEIKHTASIKKQLKAA